MTLHCDPEFLIKVCKHDFYSKLFSPAIVEDVPGPTLSRIFPETKLYVTFSLVCLQVHVSWNWKYSSSFSFFQFFFQFIVILLLSRRITQCLCMLLLFYPLMTSWFIKFLVLVSSVKALVTFWNNFSNKFCSVLIVELNFYEVIFYLYAASSAELHLFTCVYVAVLAEM